MFWRFGGYANISTLDTILDKADVTVEELLEESDLIQELKQQNSKLVEFLRDEVVLKKLLDYVVADTAPERVAVGDKNESQKSDEDRPASLSFFGRARSRSTARKRDGAETEQDKREALRKKYAYVACEVLSSEVWSITEAIMADPDNLQSFWQYLHRPAPLDPLQAGYFTKVNEALLDKKTEEMLAFFKNLQGIVPAMLQHVDCPMIMDLLLKIISLEKHEGGTGIVDWLQTQGLIPQLLAYLSSEHTSATQTSAGDFLKAIITISANATTQDQSVIGPNELTRQLVSETCIKTLITDMLRGGNALTVGVGIVIEVIRKNNSDYDLENQIGPEPKTSDPIYLGTLLRQFAIHLPDFMALISAKSAARPHLNAAFGGKIEPLGFDRFKTCELMAELLHCSNMALLNERGAEDEVRKRDAQRERLKAEGKLAVQRPSSETGNDHSHDEFGSSVDSHGFHHAARPSDDEMDEETQRTERLQVQNMGDEDEFEKVHIPSHDDLPDEVTFDDFDEKFDDTLPRDHDRMQNEKDVNSMVKKDATGIEIPRPLSPTKKSVATPHVDASAPAVNTPTSAGVTHRIENLTVDHDDAVMTEFGEEPAEHDDADDLSHEATAHLADRPAPLFTHKPGPTSTSADEDSNEASQSVATLHPHDAVEEQHRGDYATDTDGEPVVGDLLKMQFVEHQVVPTILDFFFRFPWNNFLHNVVYDVVQQVFNGTLERGYNRVLAFKLFTPVETDSISPDRGLLSTKDITDRVLDGQRASDKSQSDKGMRLGYMGHLTLIAEEVCKFGNRQPADLIDQVVFDRITRPEWVHYVEGTLTETRERDNAVLGGVRPENAINRPGNMNLGGYASNTVSNTLASAGLAPQDSLAMVEGQALNSYSDNPETLVSDFGHGEDGGDLDIEGEEDERDHTRLTASEAFTDDEQFAHGSSRTDANESTIPSPLSVPPSRARQQLAKRLAQRKKEAEDASARGDPDASDAAVKQTADQLPVDPSPLDGLGPGMTEDFSSGLAPFRHGAAARFGDMFPSGDSSSSDDDHGMFGDDEMLHDAREEKADDDFELLARHSDYARRRTFRAKERRPLDDEEDHGALMSRHAVDDDNEGDEDDDDHGMGTAFDRKLIPGSGGPSLGPPIDLNDGDSSDDEAVEIRPRRVS